MKILITTQHYWPETFQITDFAEALASAGHEVTVLTGLPNYPSGVVPEEYRRGRNRSQSRNGVSIKRAWLIPRGNDPLKLAVNYYSFALSSSRLAKKLNESFDVVIAYQTSPVMMVSPGVAYAKRHRVPLIIYCCDLWPESMKVMLGNRFKLVFVHYAKVSKRLYATADAIAVQSPSFIDYLSSKHAIARDRIRFIPQFATGSSDYVEPRSHSGINFMISGNIGRAQDMPVVLQAIAKMRTVDADFTLHVVGAGPCLEESISLAKKLGVDNHVVFYGRRPVEQMADFYAITDAFVLALNGSSWVGTTIPSRLQGYMAAGRPIFAAINGGAKEVIEESGCGLVVSAGDSDGLAVLLDQFIADPSLYAECGKRAHDYFEVKFNKENYVKSMCDLATELCESRKSGEL